MRMYFLGVMVRSFYDDRRLRRIQGEMAGFPF
jgi:hypothetical protein